MARPTKEGLEYFPLDTDIDQDEKLIVVIAKHGMRGFGVIVRLMMEVYKAGYYLHWTEREQYVLAMKLGDDTAFIQEVVDECMRWGFFDRSMHDRYKILTSKGFQKRYLLAVTRRKGVEIKKEYSLLREVMESNNPVQGELLPAETEQKKLKEIKVKEISDTAAALFEEFWLIYPKKASKVDAQRAWEALIKEKKPLDQVIQAAKNYAEECAGKESRFIKHPATFLRNERWIDSLTLTPDSETLKQTDPEIYARNRDMAFQEWVNGGGDPDAFRYDG